MANTFWDRWDRMAKTQRESVSISVKLYKDDPVDVAILDFLQDKPNTFVFKESLKLYMKAYEGIMDGGNGGAAKPSKQNNASEGQVFLERG